jgi:hypothetical protein
LKSILKVNFSSSSGDFYRKASRHPDLVYMYYVHPFALPEENLQQLLPVMESMMESLLSKV